MAQDTQLELNMDEGTVTRRLKPLADKTEQVLTEITAPLFPPLPPQDLPAPPAATLPPAAPPEKAPARDRIAISPLAKRTAQRLQVDYARLQGTGPAGRIRQVDVLLAARRQTETPPLPAPQSVLPAPAGDAPLPAPAEKTPPPPPTEDGAFPPLSPATLPPPVEMAGVVLPEAVGGTPLSKLLSEAKRIAASSILPVGQTIKADVTALVQFRQRLIQDSGRRYTVNDLVLKAAAKSLGQHPKMLSGFGLKVNIGMAVALERGFAVPVLWEADKLGLEALSQMARDLACRAREGRLKELDPHHGPAFVVSNMGMFGIEQFTPALTAPAAATLGVGAISEELDLDETGRVVKKKVMRLTLTFDPQIHSGAAAARFQATMRDLMENPMKILL